MDFAKMTYEQLEAAQQSLTREMNKRKKEKREKYWNGVIQALLNYQEAVGDTISIVNVNDFDDCGVAYAMNLNLSDNYQNWPGYLAFIE